MSDIVGDDDWTSGTILISLPCATLRYPAIPRTTVHYLALPYLAQLYESYLSFCILCRNKMLKNFESIQRAVRKD